MITKLFASVILITLSAIALSSYGQNFYHVYVGNSYGGPKPKGKVRSYTWLSYGRRDGDTLVNDLQWRYYFEYNKKRQLIKVSRSGVLDINKNYVDTYTYNKKGNVNTVTHYDEFAVPHMKDEYVYSPSGRSVTIKIHFYNADTADMSTQLKLDAAGRIVNKYTYSAIEGRGPMLLTSEQQYSYNNKGLRTEEKFYGPGGSAGSDLYNCWINKYNRYDDVVEAIDKHAQTAIDTSRFTFINYDGHQNWLTRNLYAQGKLTHVVERRITYYK